MLILKAGSSDNSFRAENECRKGKSRQSEGLYYLIHQDENHAELRYHGLVRLLS